MKKLMQYAIIFALAVMVICLGIQIIGMIAKF
jgi:hypothetical protein